MFVLYFEYRYVKVDDDISVKGVYVNLTPPRDARSWQRECKVIVTTYSFFYKYFYLYITNY